MAETAGTDQVLFQQDAPGRARRFQIETRIVVGTDGQKRVHKRALHAEGIAHLRRMAANHQIMRMQQTPVCACACAMQGDQLEWAFVEGSSLKQQLVQALRRNNQSGLESLLDSYRRLITAFDPLAADLRGPGQRADIFADLCLEAEITVKCGNIDQGFDHLILHDTRWHLIDYEWVLGFAVPLKYVLYRAAQLFFQDVPPQLSPRFRLRDMCAFYGIGPAERTLYDQMEARFQHFVRTETP